jgi:hypothetical protein
LELALKIWQFEKKFFKIWRVWALLKSYFSDQNLAKNSSKIKDTARRWKRLIGHINPLTQLEKSIWHPSSDHV